MKPKLYVMIGIPASGKSSFLADFAPTREIVSTDAIRAQINGSAESQDNAELVFKTAFEKIKALLMNKQNAYFDATNLSRKRRKVLFTNYSKYADLVAVYFATPYEECLVRNMERERKVPFHVMERMYLSLEVPSITEGWSNIKVVGHYLFNVPDIHLRKITEQEAFDNEFFGDIYGLEQGNPYHEMTVSEHSWRVYSKIYDEQKDKLNEEDFEMLVIAALYHDIGKAVAKKWVEDRNRFRYIGHENASAQKLINFIGAKFKLEDGRLSGKQVFTILDLISNHIHAHSNPDFAKKRVERPDLLMLLNDADINSKRKDGGGYDEKYLRHAL